VCQPVPVAASRFDPEGGCVDRRAGGVGWGSYDDGEPGESFDLFE